MSYETNYRIATRSSRLALWQASHVQQLLSKSGLDSTLVKRVTKGDQVLDRPLQQIGGKGLFIKELERALAAHQADIAVHSLKDLPVELPEQFRIAAILGRHSPHDVIVVNPGSFLSKIVKLESNARQLLKKYPLTLATSSLRRSAQLKSLNAEHKTAAIRGNIDTRLEKMHQSSWDGIVLAEAALDRLNLKDQLEFIRLEAEWFTPCAAQGALGVEVLADQPVPRAVSALDEPDTNRLVSIERKILALLGGDCHLPFGCYARQSNGILTITTKVFNSAGQAAEAHVVSNWRGPRADYLECVIESVSLIIHNGGKKIFSDLGLQIPPESLLLEPF